MTTFQPHGMVIPVLTPFQENGSLDEKTLRRLARRLITAGVHGVFPVGSSGEFWILDAEERYRAIRTVVLDKDRRHLNRVSISHLPSHRNAW